MEQVQRIAHIYLPVATCIAEAASRRGRSRPDGL